MILRALFRLAALAAIAVAGWWIARLFRGDRRKAQERPARGGAAEGSMVRDRVCNTFLPRARALELSVDGTTHFFCSEDCRSRFLESSGAAHTA